MKKDPLTMLTPEEYKASITGIKFTVGGSAGYTTIRICKNKDGALVRVERMPERKEPAEPVQITAKKWEKLINTLVDKAHVREWEKHYNNYEIMDGTDWNLVISLTNRRRRTYDGYNAFPPYWDKLIAFFGEFTEL